MSSTKTKQCLWFQQPVIFSIRWHEKLYQRLRSDRVKISIDKRPASTAINKSLDILTSAVSTLWKCRKPDWNSSYKLFVERCSWTWADTTRYDTIFLLIVIRSIWVAPRWKQFKDLLLSCSVAGHTKINPHCDIILTAILHLFSPWEWIQMLSLLITRTFNTMKLAEWINDRRPLIYQDQRKFDSSVHEPFKNCWLWCTESYTSTNSIRK